MRDGFLSMGHGRALLAVEDRDSQLKVYERIIKGDLSVRKTEAIVKALKNGVLFRVSLAVMGWVVVSVVAVAVADLICMTMLI